MATRVNDDQGSTTSSGTVLTTGIHVATAGNNYVLACSWEAADTTWTITDVAGNTFTPRTKRASSNGDQWLQMFDCANILGSAVNVITATSSGSVSYRSVMCIQYSGSSFVFEDEDWADVSSTSVTTPSLTASGAGVMAAFAKAYNAGSWTIGTGMSNLASSGTGYSASEDMPIASGGSYAADIDRSSSTQLTLAAAFYADAAAGGPTASGRMSLLGAGF